MKGSLRFWFRLWPPGPHRKRIQVWSNLGAAWIASWGHDHGWNYWHRATKISVTEKEKLTVKKCWILIQNACDWEWTQVLNNASGTNGNGSPCQKGDVSPGKEATMSKPMCNEMQKVRECMSHVWTIWDAKSVFCYPKQIHKLLIWTFFFSYRSQSVMWKKCGKGYKFICSIRFFYVETKKWYVYYWMWGHVFEV